MPEPYQTFYAEIPNILAGGPKTHPEIADELQEKYPEYCDDAIKCSHRNDNYEYPEWKHTARNVEQSLKSNGIIKRNPKIRKWELIRPL